MRYLQRSSFPAAFVLSLILGEQATAQFVQQGDKLIGTGAAGGARQGWSVSLSSNGNTAIVGGGRDSNGVGAAWVFTRTGGVWTSRGQNL